MSNSLDEISKYSHFRCRTSQNAAFSNVSLSIEVLIIGDAEYLDLQGTIEEICFDINICIDN